MTKFMISIFLAFAFIAKADVSFIGGAPTWAPSVDTAASLPASGSAGECRSAQDSGSIYCWNGAAWVTGGGGGGSGTVTSVGMSVPSFLSVGGSPVTTAGTLAVTLASTTAHFALIGPTSGTGVPTQRALVASDIPDLSATYSVLAGNSSLVTVGTIGTGTWNATAISAAKGGTGGSSAASTGIAHVASGTWSYSAVALGGSDVSGQLGVANGGTGLATLTANNVILGAGTSTPTFVAPGSSGNVLTSNGTTWTSAAAAGGGVTTMAAIGAVPNANAASISGSTLTMQPASASFGGVVTTGTQTLAGAKTLTSTLTVDTSAGASTGIDITVAGAKGIQITNATMGTGNSGMIRLDGTVVPVNGQSYSMISSLMSLGTSSNTRANYGFKLGLQGGGTGGSSSAGVFVDNNSNDGSDTLSVYNQTGSYGANFIARGNNSTTNAGNIGVAATASGGNKNVPFWAVTDAAAGTSAKSVGYIANITSSGASTTVGGFFRITTLTSQASYDTMPTVSAGLIASNGDTTSPIFIAQDNTTTVFQIADGGIVTIGSGTSTEHVLNTATAASASCGTLVGATACIQMTINGVTHYIPYY